MKTLIEDLRTRSADLRNEVGECEITLMLDKAADVIEGKATAQTSGRWYCVDKDGIALLCKDKAEAECKAKDLDMWRPQNAPHRAGRLVEAIEKPYDQSALEFCPVCCWNAVIPGEPCLVCERNAKIDQPVYVLLTDAAIRKIQAEHPTENDPMGFARAIEKAAKGGA